MSIILLILFFIIILFLRFFKIDLPSKRILSIFLFLWFAVLILSQYGFYGFNTPDVYTIFLLLLSVGSFILGFCLKKIKYNSIPLNLNCIHVQVNRLMNNKVFLAILILFTCYMLLLGIIFYKTLLLTKSLSDIRGSYFDSSDSMYGPYFGLINVYILSPVVAVFSALFGYCILYKRDWKLVLIFISLFIYSSLGGGRFHYIRLLVLPLVLTMFVFYQGRIRLTIKRVLSILLLGLLLLLLLSWITLGRRGEVGLNKSNIAYAMEKTIQDILTYAYGPILAFEYSIENDYASQIGGYQYGRLTLHALDDFFVIGFGKTLGIDRDYFNPSLDHLVKIKQDRSISLGQSNWNALYTWNLYFYVDFWVLGLIIFPFFIGLVSKYIIGQFYKYKIFGFFIILSFLFRAICFSFIDYTLFNMTDILLMVVIFITSKYRLKLV